MARPVKLTLSPSLPQETWRARWRLVRDLLGGALVLAVWLSLWSWVALGVVGPLSQLAGAERERAAETM
ncbi:hypothetical protein [Anaeromyxobacter sp. Fw109-5]|uniref:hypothetical protein n=1 Tax=Anaeromyxobacter sp. (strain Fw109-5) TaxID=404589 RepID=UPI000158A613|nr:hypothetical protein [Anaeromyxobacter sp. Fw109-5]ABS25091.1 hypothetical protein Anae109_0882 [Anaeromyxobacter sp. Fw109-5]